MFGEMRSRDFRLQMVRRRSRDEQYSLGVSKVAF